MQEPEIAFSRWTRWTERTSLKGIRAPGVYLLAHFDVVPAGPANPRAEQIIYIGETCKNSLMGRWRQFNRSAFGGKSGHSGGETYRQVFDRQADNLCVAAFPVEGLDEGIGSLFIRYVERKLIWEFAREWDTAPRCNRR